MHCLSLFLDNLLPHVHQLQDYMKHYSTWAMIFAIIEYMMATCKRLRSVNCYPVCYISCTHFQTYGASLLISSIADKYIKIHVSLNFHILLIVSMHESLLPSKLVTAFLASHFCLSILRQWLILGNYKITYKITYTNAVRSLQDFFLYYHPSTS